MKKTIPLFFAAVIFAAGCATQNPETTPFAAVYPGARPMSSPGAKFAVLPIAVQRTITSLAGASEIRDINKIPGDLPEVYEVEFVNPITNPNLYVAVNGSLVRTNAPAGGSLAQPLSPTSTRPVLVTSTPPNSPPTGVPLAVQQTLQLRAPNGVVSTITPVQRTVYVIEFAEPMTHPRLYIAEDGTLLKGQ